MTLFRYMMNSTNTMFTWRYMENGFFDAIFLPVSFPIQLILKLFYISSWLILPILSFCSFILLFIFKHILRKRTKSTLNRLPNDSRNMASVKILTVGFFHPYCDAGGGGERVLWCAIRALQARYDFVKCVVYTGDTLASPEDIIRRAKERFNIHFERPIHFVYLTKRSWVTAERYPILTLLGQSFGSCILGLEALCKFVPDIYFDTMGYSFTLPLFKYVGGCRVGCYVHYPTISTDMLQKVTRRQADFNNAGFISRSPFLSHVKLVYYKLFAFCYGVSGRCSDVVMVNSSWTHGHIKALWRIPARTTIVYPPCDTKNLLDLFLDEEESLKAKPIQIISVSQFRPEKNHILQLRVFDQFRKTLKSNCKNKYKLLLVGGCRNVDDEMRVRLLKQKTKELKIDKFVEFHLNVSYEVLLDLLSKSVVGLHTMQDEHFGIGVVEFMAGGVIALAHDSAGPKMDIVIEWKDNKTGYLADSVETYVNALTAIMHKSARERYEVCMNARDCVKKRFSEDTFKTRFLSETERLIV